MLAIKMMVVMVFGLYIVASVLDSLKLAYSLEPMQKPLGMRFTITFDDPDVIPLL